MTEQRDPRTRVPQRIRRHSVTVKYKTESLLALEGAYSGAYRLICARSSRQSIIGLVDQNGYRTSSATQC
jgi:hypothetical protein